MKGSSDRIATAIGLAILLVIVAFALLCVWRLEWVGDVHVYVAGINEIRAHPFAPHHESLAGETAKSSVAFTPYLYVVAAAGAVVDLDAYQSLQAAAVVNLAFFLVALWFLLRRPSLWSSCLNPTLATAMVAVVTLFVRSETFFMSSETSYDTLPSILAYPSTFAWASSFVCFTLVDRALERKHPALVVVIGMIQWFTLTSHPLTGSWLLGICALRAGAGVLQDRGAKKRALAVVVAVLAGVALSAAWPYAAFRHGAVVFATVHPPFRDTPIAPFTWLYVLAALTLARMFARGRVERTRALWFVAATAASIGVFWAGRLAHVDYVARYLYFAAFFPQILVGTEAAADVHALLDAAFARRFTRALAIPAGAVLVVVAAVLGAPIVVTPREKGALPSLDDLYSDDGAEFMYDVRFIAMRPFIQPNDVVMARSSETNLHMLAVTQAKVVAAIYSDHVPSNRERQKATNEFYRPKTTPERRAAIVKQWHVTKILVDWDWMRPVMTAQYGEPIWQNEVRALYAVTPR